MIELDEISEKGFKPLTRPFKDWKIVEGMVKDKMNLARKNTTKKLPKEVRPTKNASNCPEILRMIPTQFHGEYTKYNIER
ncbi:MAG: hypothetical protein OEY90_07450 [Candidatus Bathyarchaeota archaeon]|nr:hypothetical protein [Candidatus Bathyarchaeota archaeon]